LRGRPRIRRRKGYPLSGARCDDCRKKHAFCSHRTEPTRTPETDVEDALNRALRALSIEKKKTEALTRAVERAIRDGVSALHFAPVAAPTPDTRKKSPEVAV